jgi:hypothetical protein
VANPVSLSSEAKRNTPMLIDIELVVQDHRECCHAILVASVGRRNRSDWGLIPNLADYNQSGQSLVPMEMIFQGHIDKLVPREAAVVKDVATPVLRGDVLNDLTSPPLISV